MTLSPLAQYFVDNAHLSPDEIRAQVAKLFPEADFTSEKGKKNFWNYRSRASYVLAKTKKKPGKKKPAPKATKKKDSGPAPLEGFDPLETPDAKQLTALLLRVGLNTGEAVLARLKHVEEKQR